MTIATIRRVPVDLIIHSLAERFKESAEDGHDRLAMGLYACIDSNGLAEEWAVSGGVAQTAEWMATVITDCDSWREPTAAETRVAEVAVCKRLLVTACNLCVTQDAEDHAAATALVQAASRILGVDVSRIIRTSADVEGYKDAMALQAAREQLQAALGRTPDAPPLTLRELINCLASKHTAAVADAIAKDGFRAEMHAAIGREMAMRKQVAAMQDQFVKVRDIFDKALGTTKGATTFTLTDIAEEMALQRARFNKERDAAIKECDAARARADKAERTQADDAHAARVTLANAQSLLDKATRGRDSMCAERDRLRAQVDRMIAAMREDAPTAKTKPQPGDVVPWAEVEDGALYYREDRDAFPFRMVTQDVSFILEGPADGDIERVLRGDCGIPRSDIPAAEWDTRHGILVARDLGTRHGILVARDLGTDPEVWRKAMREWTASKR